MRIVGSNRWNKKGVRGSTMVEMVLVLMVFLSVMIGILDLGQILFFHQALAERARNAVRFGAVRPYNQTAIENMVLFNEPTQPPGRGQGDYGLNPSNITVTRTGAGSSADRVNVTICGYQFNFFSPLIGQVATAKPIEASMPFEAP